MPLKRLRALARIKAYPTYWPRKRSTGISWRMVDWFAKHGLIEVRKDAQQRLEGLYITPRGLTSLAANALEHALRRDRLRDLASIQAGGGQ